MISVGQKLGVSGRTRAGGVSRRAGRADDRPSGWKGIETLEPRALLATVAWDGGAANGDWFAAANWSTNTVPGATDDVVITNPATSVYFSTVGTATVNKLTLSGAELGVYGGTLRVFQAPSLVGGTLVASADSAVIVDAGNIVVQGAATLNESELEIRDGDLVSAGTVLRNSYLGLRDEEGSGDFTLRGICYMSGEVGENRTITLQGIVGLAATTYWTHGGGGDLVILGAVTLTSTAGVDVTLRAVGPLINAGTMNFNAGSGGARKFVGSLLNYGGLGAGRLNINVGTTFGGANATVSNVGGVVTVAAGAAMTIAGPNSVFEQESGTLAAGGTFTVAGSRSTFDFQGGTITGTPIVLSGATLSLGSAATGAAGFLVRGACTLQGTVKAGQTITVQGITALGARLEWESGLINGGTITLTSTLAAHALLVSELAPFNNQGTLNVLAGAGGNRTITGGLTNFGTINLGAATTFAGDNVLYQFNNVGSVTGTGALILATIGRWSGGSMSGTGNLTITETGRLFVAGSGTLSTTRPVNNRGEIWVDGGTFAPTGGVNQLVNGLLTGGLWNVRGSAAINFPSVIRTIGPDASVGVLGATATFNALGPLRRVDGELAIGAGRNLALSPFGGTFTNNGVVRIEAGGTLTLGTIGVPAAFVQTAAGTLDIGVAGLAASAFGRVVATGGATLAGSLVSNFVSGFVPVAGNQFQFLTSATRAGTFGLTYLPAAPATGVQYLTTGARLSVS